MRITHVVVTSSFAGTERYVCEVARRQAARGHDVTVVGGDAGRMPAELPGVTWRAAATVPAAVARLAAAGRRDVVHTHLSAADIAAALTRPAHRALLVSTRHIAGRRGSSTLGAMSVPVIERSVDVEIAISDHVARSLSRPPQLVLRNGVATSEGAYDDASTTVLVLQRLEPEKDTGLALRAWAVSGLAADGWRLAVAGEGSCRDALARQARAVPGVGLLGNVREVAGLLGGAAMLMAPAPSEPLGLSVLEAMAAGVPVIASAAGGHLETLPSPWRFSFPPGDHVVAGTLLRTLAHDPALRRRLSTEVRAHQRAHFDVEQHVDALLEIYRSRSTARRGPRANR
jgi:glycosyltransferase involved in cell wall biosynthesis